MKYNEQVCDYVNLYVYSCEDKFKNNNNQAIQLISFSTTTDMANSRKKQMFAEFPAKFLTNSCKCLWL